MDQALEEKIVGYRREFHQYPELGWTEIRTTARIAEILDEAGFEDIRIGKDAVDVDTILELVRLNDAQKREAMERAVAQGANKKWVERTEGVPGVVAVLDTGKEGPVIGFRFDIDALPDLEPEEKGYRPYEEGYLSANKGAVHSCGHDGHTAIGLGLAWMLMEMKGQLKGKVKLFFQPAEETYSGAESMVAKGNADDVDYFFSLHIALSHGGGPLKSHEIACGCHDFLSDTQLDVYFEGKSAHPCGASQEGKNAILAACTAVLNIHAIAPHEEGLFRVNVGKIEGGVAVNTIAPNANIKVEYRGETQAIEAYGEKRVMECIEGAAKIHGVSCRTVSYGSIPTAKSDKVCMDLVGEAASLVDWFEKIYEVGNVGGSDDATVWMRHVQKNGGKAVYFGLGADIGYTLHNNRFDFDESVLSASSEVCANIVQNLNG